MNVEQFQGTVLAKLDNIEKTQEKQGEAIEKWPEKCEGHRSDLRKELGNGKGKVVAQTLAITIPAVALIAGIIYYIAG